MKKTGPKPMPQSKRRSYISVMLSPENRKWVDRHPDGRKVVEALIERERLAALADAEK